MSVGTIGMLPRAATTGTTLPAALAQVDGAEETPTADGGLPPTMTIGGRQFTLRVDQATGHPQYVHQSEQRDATGARLALEIVLDLAPDGSYTRATTQALSLANGDSQTEKSVASFDNAGVQQGEVVDAVTREGTSVLTEHTESRFAAGKEVGRVSDIARTQSALDPATREATTQEVRIRGTWDNGGQPLTAQTVPTIDRTESEKYVTPGQGINKDTDRTLTFTRHGAGPLNALQWDPHGTLLVHFAGRGGQYIEREMRVPLVGADGQPDLANAEVVRTDDKQSGVVKGMTQARIWGGFASNLSWVIGVNMLRGNLGGIGKGLIAFSAAAAGAQTIGESHALLTKRNDGSGVRLAMSLYDTALTGLLAAYVTGGNGARTQLSGGQRLAASALGATGVAGNLSLRRSDPLGANAFADRLDAAKVGASLAQGSPASAFDRDWRAEPRVDSARILLG